MAEIAEQDHIDRWLEEIRDQLPRLDLRVEGIVDRIGGINRRIKRMLDETLDEHGLSSGEWHALGSLSRAANGRRTAGELASKMELSSAAMTNRLDRLEKAGLVRRGPGGRDPRDRPIGGNDGGRAAYQRGGERQGGEKAS